MNMSESNAPVKAIDILLVDDDPGDVLLTQKAFQNGKLFNTLNVAKDGIEALEYLRQEGQFKDVNRPDIILLDLNMPRMNGKETLEAIKKDPDLKSIPVVVLTTSDADKDVLQSYDSHASCFVTKPVDLGQFTNVVQSLEEFRLCVVKFPEK